MDNCNFWCVIQKAIIPTSLNFTFTSIYVVIEFSKIKVATLSQILMTFGQTIKKSKLAVAVCMNYEHFNIFNVIDY